MKVIVQVKPNSGRNEVVTAEDGSLIVRVTAPPVEGKANGKALELLARHFGVPKSRVRILRGAASRRKTVEIG